MARFRLEKMGHPGTWKRKFDDLQARFQFQTGFDWHAQRFVFLPENDLDTRTCYIMLQDMKTQVSQVSTCALPRPIPSISTAGEGRRCGQNSGPSTPCRGWKL